MRANTTGLLISCLLLSSVAGASAISVYIDNPSFESPVLADGGELNGSVPGWDGADMYNPTTSQYATAGGNGTPPGADGSQVGYAFTSGGADLQILRGPDGTLGTADDPLFEPHQVLTLTVAVGQRLDFAYGGYNIVVGAYNPNTNIYTPLASQANLFTSAPGTFQDATLSFDTSTFNPSLYGQNLYIGLYNTNSQATDFDNVRLDEVPEPSSVMLLGFGLVAVAGIRSKRTRK